jgi:hypothetical protein
MHVGSCISSVAHRSVYPVNSHRSREFHHALRLRCGSAGAVVFHSMASPGVGHATHLFGIPFSDLVNSQHVFFESIIVPSKLTPLKGVLPSVSSMKRIP